jgi:hypothetical protein
MRGTSRSVLRTGDVASPLKPRPVADGQRRVRLSLREEQQRLRRSRHTAHGDRLADADNASHTQFQETSP